VARFGVLLGLLVVSGCFPLHFDGDKTTALVSNNPFGVEAPPPAPTKASYAPATQEVSLRVDKIGRELVAANDRIAPRPLFGTIGAAQSEIFHIGTDVVYVTEGLVKQCKSNAELAAILAVELGKIVAEREARAGSGTAERMPPIRMPVGNNVQGRDSDLTAVAELGRFEQNNPKASQRSLPRPDPMKLARGYLEQAGYQPTDLDAVSSLLQEADKNVALERHFKGELPQSPWAP
jgi:predicted Zn-dependent protease